MRGKIILIAVLCISSVVLSACGQQALNITDEEEQKIINYSANVLTSHNANYNGSLKKMSDRQLADVLKKEMKDAEKKKEEEAKAKEKESQEASSASGQSSNSVSAPKDNGVPTVSIEEMADLVGLKGFSISYKGYEVIDSYPPDSSGSDSVVFSLEPASSSDSLLVLKFGVTNEGDTSADCNMLNLSPRIRFSINGEKHSFMNTLLLEDLQTLEDEFDPHETKEAVLVAEISNEKAQAVTPLVLYVKGSDGQKKIELE